MNSMSIVEQRCPRCANRRTVHLGYTTNLFCFNCRLRWDPPQYEFSEAERTRLQSYRRAVQHGLYSDWQ